MNSKQIDIATLKWQLSKMSDDDYWNESYVKKTALDFQTDEVFNNKNNL